MSNLNVITAASATDKGQIRGHNEDFILNWEPSTNEEEDEHGWLYIVADGVGGADAGEIASQYASEQTKTHFLSTSSNPDWSQRILTAMQAANTDLRQFVANKHDNSRMATTMVAMVIHNELATIANVGDSRGYHWRQNEFKQITKDQSLVAKLLEEGAITESEARNHPRKNVILYSLGSERTPQIDSFEISLQQGDILLLCSDGLTRHVANEEISDIISQQEPKDAVASLIELANHRGGEDNISVTVVAYGKQFYRKTLSTKQLSHTAVTGPAVKKSAAPQSGGRTFLWVYTLFLSLVMGVLMILIQFWLRV